MLRKIAGACLLVGGALVSLPLLGELAMGTLALLGLLLKVALVAGLIYWAWRWINSHSALAKIAGAVLLVAGGLLAFSLFGHLVVGTFGFVALALKLAVVLGLVYWGWRWLNGREVRWPRFGR